jgi:hypothetical protein
VTIGTTTGPAVGRLTRTDLEDLARWLLCRLPAEGRLQLMAGRPVIYMTLYPEVPPATVVAAVSETLNRAGA